VWDKKRTKAVKQDAERLGGVRIIFDVVVTASTETSYRSSPWE